MTTLLVLAVMISLAVLFIHATTWKGHINEWVKDYIDPEWKWSKPIYGCPMCMTPYWGSLLYWIFIQHGWVLWIATVLVASGFSALWVLVIDIKDSLKKISGEK